MKTITLLLRTFLFTSLVFLHFGTFAQKTVVVNNLNKSENTIVLKSSDNENTLLHFKVNSFTLNDPSTEDGKTIISGIFANNLTSILKKDAPNLPKFSQSIIVSDTDEMEIKILSSNFVEYENYKIAPSKGNLKKSEIINNITSVYGKEYAKNSFYPNNISELKKPYIMRDFRGQVVTVYPFAYNPITEVLRVYTDIVVEISSKGKQGKNVLTRNKALTTVDSEFNNIYKRQFINYNINEKYVPVDESGKMLILCHDDFVDELAGFVLWKNQRGLETTIVPMSEVGLTSAAIKTYVANEYNTNDLKYLLLVGDYQQIYSVTDMTTGQGNSDISYAFISGDDNYPEFFVGRFSAEMAAQVTNQANKMIAYEKYPSQGSWYTKYLSIADSIQAFGGGPGGDDGEWDWEHLRNIQEDLEGFTYTGGTELFDGDQGGDDALGNPIASDVSNAINAGCGIVNYVGVGGDEWWTTTDFTAHDASQLTNTKKLPFIWSSSKEDGYFAAQDFTCMAEAWMRAEYNGEPAGAVGMFASTVEQMWQPPMDAQDEMIDILTSTEGKRTYGGITYNGCMHMNDEYGFDGEYMTITWILFGDPSLTVRTAKPMDMEITHNPVIFSDDTEFAVNCDFDGALACISLNGVIVGTANASTGLATIPISDLTENDIVQLVVTGFNKNPYIIDVMVISPTSSYVIVDDYSINGINSLEFDQTEDIDITLMNVGTTDALNITANISTTNSYITNIANNTFAFGNITANNGTSLSSNAYTISLANNVPDQELVSFDVNISEEGTETWAEQISIIANAPELSLSSFQIDDTADGNADGVLDPNETANFIFYVENAGHADITNYNANLVLLGGGSEIIINNLTFHQDDLLIGDMTIAIFNVTASDVAVNTSFDVQLTATAGTADQYTLTDTENIIISYVPTYCDAGSDDYEAEFISNVLFGDIDNSSVLGGSYNDYTHFSTDIAVGETYDIQIANGDHWDDSDIGCWIDWNYDGDFNDENETIGIVYANPYGKASITVPEGAHIGSTRMRIRALWAFEETAEPCGNASYGEVEDYTVNIQSIINVKDVETNFSIYPNPSNGIFTIKILNENVIALPTNVFIIDITGKIVLQAILNSEHSTINISNQAKGLYFLIIKNGNVFNTVKLVVR